MPAVIEHGLPGGLAVDRPPACGAGRQRVAEGDVLGHTRSRVVHLDSERDVLAGVDALPDQGVLSTVRSGFWQVILPLSLALPALSAEAMAL